MNMPLFTGCATALVTPFLPNGQLDEPALRRLLFMQLEAKIDALVLLGHNREPCSLSMDERQRVIEIRALNAWATPSPSLSAQVPNDTLPRH